MDIVDAAEQIKNRHDFIIFLGALIKDYQDNIGEWENLELDRYLEGMKAFLIDSKESSIDRTDFTPSWSLFAKIMIAAGTYE